MSEWAPIEQAPKDGTLIDIWAKRWNPETDKFVYTRFANYRWEPKFKFRYEGFETNGMFDGDPHWVTDVRDRKLSPRYDAFPSDWRPTHYMIPAQGPEA